MIADVKKLKTWIEIDKKALLHNFAQFQKLLAPETFLMAVLKSNAYGHGISEVADALVISDKVKIQKSERKITAQNLKVSNLKNSLWFGVDNIDEALLLRKKGIKEPILVLGWIPRSRLKEAIENDVSFCLYDFKVLKYLTSAFFKSKPKAHLKIETGTNRQGILLKELTFSEDALKKANNVIEGVYTHFCDTEDSKSRFYERQLFLFNEALSILRSFGVKPKFLHCASTAASVLYPETHFNMVRVGLGLYGLYPSRWIKKKIDLKQVLTWKTRIAQIKDVSAGETVGYNRTFKAGRKMRIAILPIGYWDGYDRKFSNNGYVLIKGERAKIIGRICMNMMMADVAKVSAREGDEAVILGTSGRNKITAENLACRVGTINYEIITRINPLIPRIVV
jgi:alanine racemase